ncbi:MAG: YbhN family protein [Allorhizobium sp.]
MSTLRLLAPFALLALLALLVSRTDFDALQSAFSQISGGHVIAGLALVQVQIVVSALRWRFTAARLGQTIPVPISISEYYVASFLNQSLPGGMAGDAVRAFRMRNAGPGGWKTPAKAVLFERLSGQMAFFLMALAGLFVWPLVLGGEQESRQAFRLVLGILLVATALGGAMIIAKRHLTWIAEIGADVAQAFIRGNALVIQVVASLLIVSTYIATFFLASDAVGAPLPWTAALTIIPLCLIAMLIPAGFGGWGTREAVAMALWPLMGASSTEGLAASIVYGGLSLAGAIPGLALLSLEAIRRGPRRA